MKTTFAGLRAAALFLAGCLFLHGQSEPIVSVDIKDITVYNGMTLQLTSGGSGYTTAPYVWFDGDGYGATAVATVSNGAVRGLTLTSPGVGYTTDPIVHISPPGASRASAAVTANSDGSLPANATVIDPGAGYLSAPKVVVSGGGGSGASAVATISGGVVTNVTITGGTGYTTDPTITIDPPSGGTSTATATATVDTKYFPNPNEAYGPFGRTIGVKALGQGTYTKDSFTYSFFVNGTGIGKTDEPVLPPSPFTAYWTPSQPGAYLLTASVSDTVNKATSLAVRYFATGTAIISPVENTIVPNGSSVVIQTTATPAPVNGQAFVQRMEFWIDGQLAGTDYTYPYSFIYTPAANAATHAIETRAYDNLGQMVTPTATRNIQMVAPIGTPPTVVLKNPLDGTSVSAGSTVNLLADAQSVSGYIRNVDFYVNGVALASSQTFPFKSTWTSQVPGKYQFIAIAFDDKSNAVASAPVTVYVTGGFPTASITSPPSGTTLTQGAKLSVAVSAAAADGGISQLSKIELLVDGIVSDILPKNPDNLPIPPPLTEPFIFTWKSAVAIGDHKLSARVTDANGLAITSAEVPVTVVANTPPTVSITAPEEGATTSAGSAITITANPADPDGAVQSVEFFVNGNSLGSVTKSPYQWTWTPAAAGPYTLTAKVTDNADASTTSSPIDVTVTSASGTTGGSSKVYHGSYASVTESGEFTLGVDRNGKGTFIAYSTDPVGHTYYWSSFPVNSSGAFSVTGGVAGTTNDTGVSGTFGDKTFIGPVTIGGATPMILAGGLDGASGSSVVALVGSDNTITLYSAKGTAADAGEATIGSNGAYSIKTAAGTTYSGIVTPSAATISGNVSGGSTGSFLLQQTSSRLVNISARASASSGQGNIVAGFVVSGGAKKLLVRGIGPTLSNYGVPNVLPNPNLAIVNPSNQVLASNDDWDSALGTLADQLSAFPLKSGSKDAALQITLDPGTYTAVVSGASTPGAAMAEIYDADGGSSAGRLRNLSARVLLQDGEMATAGFVIAGDTRKKLLIRAVGPSLAYYQVTNALPDPTLKVVASDQTQITSNDNWTGSDVSSAATAVYAFPLPINSKDAAVVTQLMPGTYTVQVTGTKGTTGIVLIEIYDLDP